VVVVQSICNVLDVKMDPLSIAASSSAVVGLCFKVKAYILVYIAIKKTDALNSRWPE
jgi:hypothetical protein